MKKQRVSKYTIHERVIITPNIITKDDLAKAVRKVSALKDLAKIALKHKRIFEDKGRPSFSFPRFGDVVNEIRCIRKKIRHIDEVDHRQQILRHAESGFKYVYSFKYAEKSGVSGMVISVRYMWGHKIYDRFYKKGFLPRDKYVVLEANEMIINDRNLRLFTCKAYNRRTGEIENKYIAQSRITKIASIGQTAQTAARSVLGKVSKFVDRKIAPKERKSS